MTPNDNAQKVGWQPIETAPHGDVAPDEPEVSVIAYSRHTGQMTIERARAVDRMRRVAEDDFEDCVFTHWMHLPEPPNAD